MFIKAVEVPVKIKTANFKKGIDAPQWGHAKAGYFFYLATSKLHGHRDVEDDAARNLQSNTSAAPSSAPVSPTRRSNNGFSQLRVFISGRCLLCPSEQTLSDQTSGRRRLRHDHKRPMMSTLNYTKQGTTFCIIRVPPKSKNEKQNEENEGQTSLQTSFQPHKISLHDGNGGGLTWYMLQTSAYYRSRQDMPLLHAPSTSYLLLVETQGSTLLYSTLPSFTLLTTTLLCYRYSSE